MTQQSKKLSYESGIMTLTDRGLSARMTCSDKTMVWHNGGSFDGTTASISGSIEIVMKRVAPSGEPPRRLLMKGTVDGTQYVAFETDHAHILSLVPDNSSEKPAPVPFGL